jgi:hypothetical protein
MTLKIANVSVHLDFAEDGVAGFNGIHSGASLDALRSLIVGTGAGQCDLAYAAERPVNSASNDDIDLNGVLTGALGNTISAVEIVGLLIINRQKDGTKNTTALTVGGGTNPVTGALSSTVIPPGGFVLLYGGDTSAGIFPVVASTADILRIANASGAQNKYQIALLGRSA